jgi:hypothetical protein
MLNNKRYWGEIQWVFSHLPEMKWSYIGAISTEDRSVQTLSYLKSKNCLLESIAYEIHDPPSTQQALVEKLIKKNRKKFASILQDRNKIEEHGLLEGYQKYISSIDKFLTNSTENIVLDISSLPKRFFFPFLKRILEQKKVKNFLVTYTTPKEYSAGDLSGNPESWSHLPLFGPIVHPEPDFDMAFVGVGFMPFALPRLLLGKYSSIPVKFLFPFPPGPPNFQRTWEFMRKIEKDYKLKDTDSIIRVDSNNATDTFDFIYHETNQGKHRALFAPYGPKPTSLAMCLFAIKHNSSVFYTQPRFYNPEYSKGVGKIYSYCVRLNGKNLY